MNKPKQSNNRNSTVRPDTPGGRLLNHVSKTLKMELAKKGIPQYQFWREHAEVVSHPTFRRVLDGELNTSVCAVADIADMFGYRLRLVKKSKNREEDEDND